LYYIVYGLLYIISLLPLSVLYLFSDFAFFLLYYLIGYREKIVLSNLRQAFPAKTEEERKKIAKQFYRNFADNFIEFVKMISASPSYLKKHITGDYSLPLKIYNEGRRSQLLLAHSFNWEWACVAVAAGIRQKFLAVYMPITNKVVNRIFMKVRSKTGAILLPATDMRSAILPYRNEVYMIGLVADQNPGDPSGALWYNFFGKPTPFVRGPESSARRGNTPVLFCKFVKEKRGHYKILFEMGEENPAALKEGDLTKKYINFLQQIISDQPDNWLWSHRRWKWDWREEYDKVRN